MYDYLEVYGDGNYEVDGYGITGHGKDSDGEYYYRDIPWPTEHASIDLETENDSDDVEHIYKIIVEEGITYLGANAFHDMKYLTEISLPSTLEKIGTGCFYGCEKLKEIEIPESVTELGEKDTVNRFAMFEYCFGLEKVIIPENSRLKYIESGAFYEAGNMDGLEIYIPEQVEEIGWAAFDGSFSSIKVSENNNNYCSEDGVLYSKDMTTLISYPKLKKSESFKVPKTVTRIESRALHGFGTAYFDFDTHQCTKTVKLYIPESVREMGEEALRTEMDIEVFFAGNKSQWEAFEDSDSIDVVSDNIHFNYSTNKIGIFVIALCAILAIIALGTSAFATKKKHSRYI